MYPVSATICIATSQERHEEQMRVQSKSWLRTTFEGAWDYLLNKVNTLAIRYFDAHTITGWYIDKDQFLSTMRIAGRVIHISRDPRVIEAILRHHRNSDLFSLKTNNGLIRTIQEYFPQSGLSSDDIMLLCGPDATKRYRNVLHSFFTSQNLQKTYPVIETLIDDTIRLWADRSQQGEYNLSDAAREYSCGIIANVFLGHEGPCSERLCQAIKTAILRIADNVLQRNCIAPDVLQTSRSVLQATISVAGKESDCPTIVQAMREACFSDAQIYGMIFTLFLAGRDNSSTVISYALLKCAQDAKLQDMIRDDISQKEQTGMPYRRAIATSAVLRSVIAESLRMLPPVAEIVRDMKEDSILTIAKDDSIIRRYYIYAHEQLSASPYYLARNKELFGINTDLFYVHRHVDQRYLSSLVTCPWMPFGRGAHPCPGWELFQLEITWLIADLLCRYQLSTSQMGEPEQYAALKYTAFTNGPKHDILIRLRPRS